MAQQLPLIPSVANYQFGTTLDGVAFIIEIRFNDREVAWYMNLLADDETPIRQGIKLVLGTLLGGRSASAAFPDGSFVLSDLSGAGLDATFDDMGDRVVLQYIPVDELIAATDTESGATSGGIIIPEIPGGGGG